MKWIKNPSRENVSAYKKQRSICSVTDKIFEKAFENKYNKSYWKFIKKFILSNRGFIECNDINLANKNVVTVMP